MSPIFLGRSSASSTTSTVDKPGSALDAASTVLDHQHEVVRQPPNARPMSPLVLLGLCATRLITSYPRAPRKKQA